jgi:hypothetical protein
MAVGLCTDLATVLVRAPFVDKAVLLSKSGFSVEVGRLQNLIVTLGFVVDYLHSDVHMRWRISTQRVGFKADRFE